MRLTIRYIILSLSFLLVFHDSDAQILKLKVRKANALGGKAFALSISDSTLTLQQREEIIFKEIKDGNVPGFLRKLKAIKDTVIIESGIIITTFYTIPDYFCIGSNADFFYVPMTPILAQRIADLTNCSLPTKKIVDLIYTNATIKLAPQPIPPTKAMTTVPIFMAHTDSILVKLAPYLKNHSLGDLTAGNKKDLVISNKIYGEKSDRVVIYGWHKIDGKAIQPLYNKHINTWADYSHGIRLVQNKIIVANKKSTIKKLLKHPKYCVILSDEGVIEKPYYPITIYKLAN